MSGFLSLIRLLSLRHLTRAPGRSSLVLAAVALGVAMVVGTRASNAAVQHAFDELAERTGGRAQLEIVGDESGVDQALIAQLSDAPDLVAHVAGRIEQPTVIEGAPGEPARRVLVLGVDLLGELTFVPFDPGAAAFRDPLALLDEPHAALITQTLAAERGLGPGGTLRLRTVRGVESFVVEQVLGETGATRAFGGETIVLALDAAQLAFGREGRVDRIDVALAPGVPLEDGRRRLQALVGARARVAPPSDRSSRLTRMTAAFTGGLEITGAIAVAIGMFLVYNAVSIAVGRRRREIGVLRALGVGRAPLAAVFLVEATLLGALGGALGVIAGSAIARVVVAQFGANVSRFFENIAAPRTVVGPRLACVGVAVGVGATVLAALLPALRAASVAPVEALRRDVHAVVARRAPRRGLLVLGVVSLGVGLLATRVPSAIGGLLAVGAVFFGAACAAPAAIAGAIRPLGWLAERVFGIPARIGVDNVGRELGRSALAVTALMLAAALGLTMSTYTHSYEVSCLEWVEQSIPADLLVSAGSPLANDRDVLPFEPRWADVVRGVEGVDRVDRVRTLSVPYVADDGRELRLEVLSLDSAIYLGELAKNPYPRVLEGPRTIPVDALSSAPAALVSENLAHKLGLHSGSTLVLPTPLGPRPLAVVASVVDYSSDQGLVLIDRRLALEWFGDPRLDSLHVYLRAGEDPTAMAAAVRAALARSTGGDAALFVTTNAALKEEIRDVVRRTFGISRASEVIALVVAVLGVIGAILAGVLDRRRELGVFRAVGAGRAQVVAAVVAEAACLGACAATLAVLAAIPAALVFVDVVSVQASGWHVAFRVPWGAAARVVLGSIVVAGLSGWGPGVRAARAEVTDALAYE